MSDKLQIMEGDIPVRDIPLDKPRLTIGHDEDCAIQLPDRTMAGKHAAVERRDGAWNVRAFDPGRGIGLDGKMHTSVKLEPGSVFTLGETRVRFLSGRSTTSAPAPAASASPVPTPVPITTPIPSPIHAPHLAPITSVTAVETPGAMGELARAHARILEQAQHHVIGQQKVIEQILVAMFAQGHCLLIGVPGLAKTLIVRTLAGCLELSNKRIQFTPDLMPADITGTDILEEDTVSGARHFRFKHGPVFANLVLADEINRTPPKTQAALLEAMQERQVTAAGVSYDLPKPFFVLATQNPIEQEGTYPLPEAQLDRFMFCIKLDYPNAADEQRILLETTRDSTHTVEHVLSAADILRYQQLVRQVPVSPHVAHYATDLIRATRPGEGDDWIKQYVRWGAGTRAGQYLLLAGKAHALLMGRSAVSCADVRIYAAAVLRHRICCTFAAGAEGIDPDAVVARIIAQVKEPSYH